MTGHRPWREIRHKRPTTITLAGIPVRRDLVTWIADQLDNDPTGDRLRRALDNDVRILALEIDEREAILRALEDPAPGLEELRAVLLQEHVARKRDSLA